MVLVLATSCAGQAAPTEEQTLELGAPQATTSADAPSSGPTVGFAPGPLEPGTYTTELFRVPMTVEIRGDRWQVPNEELSDAIELLWSSRPAGSVPFPEQQLLGFVLIDRVLSDPYVDADTYFADPTAATEEAPGDLIAWLQTIDGVRWSGVRETAVAGHPARSIDGDVRDLPPAADFEACQHPCAALFSVSNADLVGIFEGKRYRFTVVDVEEDRLLAVIDAPRDQFDDFLPRAQRLMDSVQLTP